MAIFRDGEISVDLDQQAVTKDGKPVGLLSWEYGVLAALVSRQGEVISSYELVEAGWGTTGEQMTKRVMYAVLGLQFKLGWGGRAWRVFRSKKSTVWVTATGFLLVDGLRTHRCPLTVTMPYEGPPLQR